MTEHTRICVDDWSRWRKPIPSTGLTATPSLRSGFGSITNLMGAKRLYNYGRTEWEADLAAFGRDRVVIAWHFAKAAEDVLGPEAAAKVCRPAATRRPVTRSARG